MLDPGIRVTFRKVGHLNWYAQSFYSGSHDAVIRVYDETGNVIETQEHAGDSKNRSALLFAGFSGPSACARQRY
jgi:hypothetical protein